VQGIFLDANVRDVALGELALLVELGEARIDDALPLIVEALGARHAC
jgi:hypothetical protein